MHVDTGIIRSIIEAHEEYSTVPFRETPSGRVKVGLGFKLSWPGASAVLKVVGVDAKELLDKTHTLTASEIKRLLDITVGVALSDAETIFPNFDTLPLNIQAVVADLLFDMGYDAFAKNMKPFIAAIKRENYGVAATTLRNSSYFRGAGIRGRDAIDLLMETHRDVQRAAA